MHRTAELRESEAALSLALVCLVVGTRPEVSTAMVGEYLMHYFGFDPANFSVRRHDPEDFIVRFAHQHELETVLQTVVPDPPFRLIWNRWRRTSLAAAGSFQFRVLVGMRRLPLHARSLEVAQTILGTACAHLEIAPPGIAPVDDDHEFFVAAWCLHPCFIPDEKIIFIPEPNPLIPGAALYLQADDVVLNWLPGLKYLVCLRIVEIQDWGTPPPSDDDEGPPRLDPDEEDDSDSSNPRFHPSLDDGGDRARQHGARSVRFTNAGDNVPHLGVRRGPTFMSRCSVLVGSVQCPYLNVAAHGREVMTSGEVVRIGTASPETVAPTEAAVLESREMILMENNPNPSAESGEFISVECTPIPIVLDEAEALLPILRNDNLTLDTRHVDLSHLEQGTLEPKVLVVTPTPPSALAFDDDVSMVGRRQDTSELCGLLGSLLSDMSLLETTPISPAPAQADVHKPPRECQASQTRSTPPNASAPGQLAPAIHEPLQTSEDIAAADPADSTALLLTDVVAVVPANDEAAPTLPVTTVDDFISSIST